MYLSWDMTFPNFRDNSDVKFTCLQDWPHKVRQILVQIWYVRWRNPPPPTNEETPLAKQHYQPQLRSSPDHSPTSKFGSSSGKPRSSPLLIPFEISDQLSSTASTTTSSALKTLIPGESGWLIILAFFLIHSPDPSNKFRSKTSFRVFVVSRWDWAGARWRLESRGR